jgi:hypothetical protein
VALALLTIQPIESPTMTSGACAHRSAPQEPVQAVVHFSSS